MAQADFDRIIDRSGTNSIAVSGFRKFLFDDEDLTLPCPDDEAVAMWVADMSFASAPAAVDAMRERLDHPVFGYTVLTDDGLFDAFSAWCDRRYGWSPQQEHFLTSPGIVPALHDLVEHILQPGQKALTLTPGYEPFKKATDHHDRELVTCGLVADGTGSYTVDLADFEAKVSDPSVRLFFLCHPHNPTGRSWQEDELRAMAECCFAHDVIVVSDEIHCDLLRAGNQHTPLVKLFPDSDQIITTMSASKTFNLAGLGIANVIIPNDEIRDIWVDRTFPVVNPVSVAAAEGAFRNGDAWLNELGDYLDANFELVSDMLAEQLPEAVFRIPDATYLAWIDLSAYLPGDIDLTRFFAERTGVLIEGAEKFIADAGVCIRVNVACPRSVLADALSRIIAATLG